jgi:hypothetical protein
MPARGWPDLVNKELPGPYPDDWSSRAPRPRSRGEVRRLHNQARSDDRARNEAERVERVNRAADSDLDRDVQDILGYSVGDVQRAFNQGSPPPPDLGREIAKISKDIRKGRSGSARRRAKKIKPQVKKEMAKRSGCLRAVVVLAGTIAGLGYGAAELIGVWL